MDINLTTQSYIVVFISKQFITYEAKSLKELSKTPIEANIQVKIIQESTSVKTVIKQSKILTKTKHQDLDKGRNQNQLRKFNSVKNCTQQLNRRRPCDTHRLVH